MNPTTAMSLGKDFYNFAKTQLLLDVYKQNPNESDLLAPPVSDNIRGNDRYI